MNTIDKIICVGKNYLEHAKELGDAIPDKPVLFLKPASVLKQIQSWNETTPVELPQTHDETHYECEIILKVKNNGYQLTQSQAENSIEAVSIGLDMTLRSLQAQLKKAGHPWTTSKVFINSAIAGPWVSLTTFPDYMNTAFSFALNKTVRQEAVPREMTFNPTELLIYISHFFPLCAGDIIFTGTPAGVGAVKSGDTGELKWGDHSYSVVWK